MQYFGVEIFDGMPQKALYLEEAIPLAVQWFHLTQDVTCIQYFVQEVLEFYLDVGWYPEATITPESCFKIEVVELSYTEGAVFYRKEAETIGEMKLRLAEAAALISSFKSLPVEEIMRRAAKTQSDFGVSVQPLYTDAEIALGATAP